MSNKRKFGETELTSEEDYTYKNSKRTINKYEKSQLSSSVSLLESATSNSYQFHETADKTLDISTLYEKIANDIQYDNFHRLQSLSTDEVNELNKYSYTNKVASLVDLVIEKGNDIITLLLIDKSYVINTDESFAIIDIDDGVGGNNGIGRRKVRLFKSFCLAYKYNRSEVIKQKLKKEMRLKDIEKLLELAVHEGNTEAIQTVLNDNDVCCTCDLAFEAAVTCNNINIVKLLYDLNIVKFIYGRLCHFSDNVCKALFSAMTKGHTEIVEYFLSKLKNQACKLSWVDSALIYAAREGKTELVTTLIIEGNSNFLVMPFAEAICNGHNDIKSILHSFRSKDRSDHKEICDAIDKIVKMANAEDIKMLLDFCGTDEAHLCERRLFGWPLSRFKYIALGAFAAEGRVDIVKYLISRGANAFNETLATAAMTGDIEMMEVLIAAGAVKLNDAMFAACRKGKLESVKFLHSAGADNLDRALFETAGERAIEVVQYLTEAGATATVSCFEAAVDLGKLDILEFYIYSKKLTISVDYLNEFLLSVADEGQYVDVAKFLFSLGANSVNNALNKSASKCSNLNLEMVQFFVDAGATNLNNALQLAVNIYQDNEYSVDFSKTEAIKVIGYLISKGANPFAEIIDARTRADHLASALENVNSNALLVKLFLETIKVNDRLKSSTIKKCFLCAVQSGFMESVKIYLDNGFDVNGKNGQSIPIVSVLDSTIRPSNTNKMIELLLEKGANINIQTSRGKTALIAAVKAKKLNCVKFLVEKGAFLDLKDSDNKTALFWAATTKNPDQLEMVKFLIDAGADGRDLVTKKSGKSLEELVDDKFILNLIKTSNDAKPLYLFK